MCRTSHGGSRHAMQMRGCVLHQDARLRAAPRHRRPRLAPHLTCSTFGSMPKPWLPSSASPLTLSITRLLRRAGAAGEGRLGGGVQGPLVMHGVSGEGCTANRMRHRCTPNSVAQPPWAAQRADEAAAAGSSGRRRRHALRRRMWPPPPPPAPAHLYLSLELWKMASMERWASATHCTCACCRDRGPAARPPVVRLAAATATGLWCRAASRCWARPALAVAARAVAMLGRLLLAGCLWRLAALPGRHDGAFSPCPRRALSWRSMQAPRAAPLPLQAAPAALTHSLERQAACPASRIRAQHSPLRLEASQRPCSAAGRQQNG